MLYGYAKQKKKRNKNQLPIYEFANYFDINTKTKQKKTKKRESNYEST